jgi:hypothetical protein
VTEPGVLRPEGTSRIATMKDRSRLWKDTSGRNWESGRVPMSANLAGSYIIIARRRLIVGKVPPHINYGSNYPIGV